MANVFNMTFEELLKQAGAGTVPAEETKAEGTPAEEAPAAAQPTKAPAEEVNTDSGEMSFEAMVAAAQNAQAAKADIPLDMNPPKQAEEASPATEATSKEEAPEESGQVSFDELVRQAEAAQRGEAPKEETPKAEEKPAEEVPKEEKPAEEKLAEETPKAEEKPAEETPKEEEKPVKTEETPKEEEKPVEETPKEEKPKKKASKGKKAKKTEPKAEASEESPVDQTEEYRVDLEPKKEEGETLKLEKLFTEEELSELRKAVRSLVYNEFKAAVVDAVKELCHEFAK